MEGSSWQSYPKIWHIGHNAIKDIFEGDFLVEEKVDGSQISFGIFEDGLRIKSKSAFINLEFPDKLFEEAVLSIKSRSSLLTPGWTYRGEYLKKPKHNVLSYERIPDGHIILFDINPAQEKYLPYEAVETEAKKIGLETVQRLDLTPSVDGFHRVLKTLSSLGGQTIEGVVIKNYQKFTALGLGQVMMGKYVSEAFKEVARDEWKIANPGSNDILEQLILELKTKARWNKAVIHLKESGDCTDSPKDIGLLFKNVQQDLQVECSDYIKDRLFSWAWPRIARGSTHGLPEWYKEKLLRDAIDSANEKEF